MRFERSRWWAIALLLVGSTCLALSLVAVAGQAIQLDATRSPDLVFWLYEGVPVAALALGVVVSLTLIVLGTRLERTSGVVGLVVSPGTILFVVMAATASGPPGWSTLLAYVFGLTAVVVVPVNSVLVIRSGWRRLRVGRSSSGAVSATGESGGT